MSVNQISQDYHWWNTQNQFHNYNFNHHKNDDVFDNQPHHDQPQPLQQQQSLESMFEKSLTPSDVGKLNRLVIPKQHAERHFPLNTSNGVDSGGMLLSFEDEEGKFWRFRYSYWNSSQSYVLTKGWSRYVKEKRLESGDFVVFQRHPTDPDRFFIGWRRRQNGSAASASAGVNNQGRMVSFNGSTSSRTLRLFGVNMECQFENDQSELVTPPGYYGMSNLMVQKDGSHSQHRG